MAQALRQETVVLAGGRVQINSSTLTEGARVEVIVLSEDAPRTRPLSDFWGKGAGQFKNTQEIVDWVRSLRDEWDEQAQAE